MPKASEVAAELRKLADHLEREPDAEIPRIWPTFFCHGEKEKFLAVARLFPRPFSKNVTGTTYPELKIIYETPAMKLDASVYQSSVCRLVKPAQPAEYECDPLLSPDEEAQLTEA